MCPDISVQMFARHQVFSRLMGKTTPHPLNDLVAMIPPPITLHLRPNLGQHHHKRN